MIRGLTTRVALVGLALLTSGLGGCPKVRPLLQHQVPDRVLLREAQLLVAQLKKARLGAPSRLVEAWLAHFRSRPDERDRAICTWLTRTSLAPTAAAARLSALPGEGPRPGRLRVFLGTILRSNPKRCRALRDQAYKPQPGQRIRPGLYSYSETRTGLQGDSLTIAERWIVRPKAAGKKGVLSGLYLRRLERVSGDGRRYLCSKRSRYSVLMAFSFELRRRRGRLILEETDAFIRPGPCAPKRVRLDRCAVQVSAVGILLRCPEERQLTRLGSLAFSQQSSVYRWSQTSPRTDGGRQQISEQWHLAILPAAPARTIPHRPAARPAAPPAAPQSAPTRTLIGFYTRHIRALARRGKTFACNAKSSHQLKHLYLLSGKLTAEGKVELSERAALHRPHPCDRGKVKLDSYRGRLGAGKLTLSWGGGKQSLRLLPAEPALAFPFGKLFKK